MSRYHDRAYAYEAPTLPVSRAHDIVDWEDGRENSPRERPRHQMVTSTSPLHYPAQVHSVRRYDWEDVPPREQLQYAPLETESRRKTHWEEMPLLKEPNIPIYETYPRRRFDLEEDWEETLPRKLMRYTTPGARQRTAYEQEAPRSALITSSSQMSPHARIDYSVPTTQATRTTYPTQKARPSYKPQQTATNHPKYTVRDPEPQTTIADDRFSELQQRLIDVKADLLKAKDAIMQLRQHPEARAIPQSGQEQRYEMQRLTLDQYREYANSLKEDNEELRAENAGLKKEKKVLEESLREAKRAKLRQQQDNGGRLQRQEEPRIKREVVRGEGDAAREGNQEAHMGTQSGINTSEAASSQPLREIEYTDYRNGKRQRAWCPWCPRKE